MNTNSIVPGYDLGVGFGVGYEFAPGTDIILFYSNPLQLYEAGSVSLHFTTSM